MPSLPGIVASLARRVSILRTRHASIVMLLPDGRALAAEEYGDPAGPPVFYFHGWPASRLEAGLLPRMPVRLLSLDRPGYGRSSACPGRTMLDWATDVGHVADRLGLRQFHVVGLSGGGPFAAACAYAMPDRVLGVALVCPVPPATSLARGPTVGHLYRLGRHPRAAHGIISILRPLLRRRILTPRTLVGASLPDADRAMLTRRTMAALGLAWREGVGRSGQGALSDAVLYARPWGFDPANIRVPVALWYGADDSVIPRAAMAPYEAIPNVRVHMLDNEGHYSLPLRHGAAILRRLTQPAVQHPSTSDGYSDIGPDAR